MIDINQVHEILEERKKLHPDDPQVKQKWIELSLLLSSEESETIEFLNNCGEEELKWIGEIFEDISEQLRSRKLIQCMEMLCKKFPNLELEQDVFYARKVLEGTE